MPRPVPPRYAQNMMADHLRRGHHIASLDLAQVGVRTSRRSHRLLRWHPNADDPLGVSYRCSLCWQRDGEGWDRYYAAVYWPWPLAHHETEIAAHYRDHHADTEFDAVRVSSPGRPIRDWQASFIPLTPHAPAAFLCAACRPAAIDRDPVLARRVQIGTDAYGDARRLRALRASRSDLRRDLAGRDPRQQADLIEVRDRGVLVRDLAPSAIRRALAIARSGRRHGGHNPDRLEAAVIALLGDAKARGESPTRVIQRLAAMATQHPERFTTTVGLAIPVLAARKASQTPAEFRRSVRDHLNRTTAPAVSERRLWDIWARHVRDAD